MANATSSSPLTVIDQEVRNAARVAGALASQLQGRSSVVPPVFSGIPHPAAQEFASALTHARSRHDAGLHALASYFVDAASGLSNFDTAVGTHESDHAALFRGEARA